MQTHSATSFTPAQLADCFNEAWIGYIGNPVTFTGDSLSTWMQTSDVSLPRSQAVITPDNPTEVAAFALVALRDDRPGRCRLVCLAVRPSSRGKGVGVRLMQAVIEAERVAGIDVMELEVIRQNTAALKLYQKLGFSVVRELRGWERDAVAKPSPPTTEDGATGDGQQLESVPLDTVTSLIKQFSSEEMLPWQIWTPAITPEANTAFKLGHAYCIISNPSTEANNQQLKMQSLIVEPLHRKRGEATRLVEAVLAKFGDRSWLIAQLFPAEMGERLAARFDFKETKLWQCQMTLTL